MFELIEMTELPGDQPELRKCTMPLIQNYQSKIAGHGLELKRIAERLLIQKKKNCPMMLKKQPSKLYLS